MLRIFNHREIVGTVKCYFSSRERVVAIVKKLKKLYRLKIVQSYALKTSDDDEVIGRF